MTGFKSYLKKEIQAKESTAGNDGKACSISACDGLWHIWRILADRERFYLQKYTFVFGQMLRLLMRRYAVLSKGGVDMNSDIMKACDEAVFASILFLMFNGAFSQACVEAFNCHRNCYFHFFKCIYVYRTILCIKLLAIKLRKNV